MSNTYCITYTLKRAILISLHLTRRFYPLREATTMTTAVEPKPAFTGQGFFNLTLQNVKDINHNTKWFRFALPEKNQISGLQTASCVVTKFTKPDTQQDVIRAYTPTSTDDDKGHIDFIIKKYPTGEMSSHIHNLKPGESLEFKGPIPKYPWTKNKHSHVAMIAGGTGITPMYQLLCAIFKDPEDKTKVTLAFGNITEKDILLKDELAELEKKYPDRLRVVYVLSQPPESWQGGKGHINKELLKEILPTPKEENIKVFVCGPPPMYKAISGVKVSPTDQGTLDGSVLQELGYSQDQVFKF
ncbi:NADH-cytochrome b5 reductase 2 [Podosphaera aphanis]|nr:NADH-cytochrome b5 reductase 2 [Podosphaera aphanis]